MYFLTFYYFLFTKIQKAFVLAILYKILLFMRTYYTYNVI